MAKKCYDKEVKAEAHGKYTFIPPLLTYHKTMKPNRAAQDVELSCLNTLWNNASLFFLT